MGRACCAVFPTSTSLVGTHRTNSVRRSWTRVRQGRPGTRCCQTPRSRWWRCQRTRPGTCGMLWRRLQAGTGPSRRHRNPCSSAVQLCPPSAVGNDHRGRPCTRSPPGADFVGVAPCIALLAAGGTELLVEPADGTCRAGSISQRVGGLVRALRAWEALGGRVHKGIAFWTRGALGVGYLGDSRLQLSWGARDARHIARLPRVLEPFRAPRASHRRQVGGGLRVPDWARRAIRVGTAWIKCARRAVRAG